MSGSGSTRVDVADFVRQNPNLTYREIAGVFGISIQRVHQIAKAHGISKPPCWNPHKRGPRVSVQEMAELYYGQRMTLEQVANALNCSTAAVWERLTAAGFTERHRGLTGFRSKPHRWGPKKAEMAEAVPPGG